MCVCVCVCLYLLAILCVKREGYRDRFVDDVVETECRERKIEIMIRECEGGRCCDVCVCVE